MTDTFEWQGRVGDTWATEWQRTDRSFGELQAILLDRIAGYGDRVARVLDIGCGAGATSLAVAERLPRAQILGIDLSSSLVAVANTRASGHPCRFVVADASTWDDPAFRPDLLISRHGVMFFDDPVSAFAHLGAVSTPGARLIFSCFRSPAENAWATEIMALLPDAPASDPHAPGPFAFADRSRVEDILAKSGWKNASPEPVDIAYIAGAGEDPVADALDFFSRIGPAARIAQQLDDASKADFMADLDRVLRNHLYGGTVTFSAAAWIWTATF
jgi:SAM-dependent methyltransferase